jgi:hypothetical protein
MVPGKMIVSKVHMEELAYETRKNLKISSS